MLYNHLILCRPLLLLPSVFPSIGVFSNASALHIRWPKYWSFSFSIILPMNIQGWFPLGLTGLISLLSKGLSKSLIQHHNLKASVLWHSLLYGSTLISIHDFWKNHNFDYSDLCWQSDVSVTFGDRLPIGTSKHCIRCVPLIVGVPTHTSFVVKICYIYINFLSDLNHLHFWSFMFPFFVSTLLALKLHIHWRNQTIIFKYMF